MEKSGAEKKHVKHTQKILRNTLRTYLETHSEDT
jgi:hypothetical protein